MSTETTLPVPATTDQSLQPADTIDRGLSTESWRASWNFGKTWALRYYKQQHYKNTVLAELGAADGLGGMMRTLGSASGISDRTNYASLQRAIRRVWNPDLLVIIDEMHLLKGTYRKDTFYRCVEVIRRLYDACHCPLLLCWTDVKDLEAASDAELVQVWRRGVHKTRLPSMPTKADLGCILHRHGFPGEPVRDEGRIVPDCIFPARDLTITLPSKQPIILKPYEVLRDVAKKDGLLAITERIRYAKKLAARADGQVSWTAFIDAHVRLEKQWQETPAWT